MAVKRRLGCRCPTALLLALTVAVLAPSPWVIAADCNSNGIDDALEIAEDSALDCNENGLPDACELRSPLRLGAGVTTQLSHWPRSIVVGDLDAEVVVVEDIDSNVDGFHGSVDCLEQPWEKLIAIDQELE